MATATLPNVCKMPGPPAPFVPTPLPNIGKSGDSPKGYTKRVMVEGQAVAVKGASFNSVDDAASKGTGGGVVSANTHGPTEFAGPGSMNVKFEGKNVQLLGDPMLNNCGPSGSPPNSATLLGVIQGPLLVVVEGTETCPDCHQSAHSLVESDSTRAEAASLESTLRGAGFAARDISMLGVAHCRCGKVKSAARSTMQRSGDFSKAASGYLTPVYKEYAAPDAVLAKIRATTRDNAACDLAIAIAKDRRKTFEELSKADRAKAPQVTVPGTCAAPRACARPGRFAVLAVRRRLSGVFQLSQPGLADTERDPVQPGRPVAGGPAQAPRLGRHLDQPRDRAPRVDAAAVGLSGRIATKAMLRSVMSTEKVSWWARVRLLRALRADPARIGDASVLQSDLLGVRMRDDIRARVEGMCAHSNCDRLRPRLDHAALRRSPPGTFGRAYADFCAANAVVPATISDAFADDARRNPAIARYICLHDMFHVLLGCDTSLPGELRITAFIMEQRYFAAGKPFLALLAIVAPLLRPHEFKQIRENMQLGRELARRAPILVAEPLEDWLAADLGAVQRRLGLPVTV